MASEGKFELKFSERQFKLTNDFINRENRKKLANLKLENQKKIDKIKALKLKLSLKNKIRLILFLLLKIQ